MSDKGEQQHEYGIEDPFLRGLYKGGKRGMVTGLILCYLFLFVNRCL